MSAVTYMHVKVSLTSDSLRVSPKIRLPHEICPLSKCFSCLVGLVDHLRNALKQLFLGDLFRAYVFILACCI